MKSRYTQGFTLVELAIVMTIVGLLIGSLLKGQEMIANARMNATITQIQAYKAAVISFEDIYRGLPGDLRNSSTRIPGCNAGCETAYDAWHRNGDGVVGLNNWSGATQLSGAGGMTHGDVLAPMAGYETMNFWTHLLLANLIGGVTDQGIRQSIPLSFGSTHPAAPLGGGFRAVHTSGEHFYTDPPAGSVPLPKQLTLVLINAPRGTIQTAFDWRHNVLRAVQAEKMDLKMDDGKPGAGNVRAGGGSSASGGSGCYITAADAYNIQGTGISCKLFIGLMSVN